MPGRGRGERVSLQAEGGLQLPEGRTQGRLYLSEEGSLPVRQAEWLSLAFRDGQAPMNDL